MKTISLLQPWASLVVIGAKKIETRSWNTNYRGEILIHASVGKYYGKGENKVSCRELCYKKYFKDFIGGGDGFDKLPFGAIVGKVNIISTESSFMLNETLRKEQKNWMLHPNREFMNKFFRLNIDHEQELSFGDYSPGRYGWLLSDPVQFTKPISAKGQLNIWNYEL